MQTRSFFSKDGSGHSFQSSDDDASIPAKDNASAGVPAKKNAKWNVKEKECLINILFETGVEGRTSNFMFKEWALNWTAVEINKLNMKGISKNAKLCRNK